MENKFKIFDTIAEWQSAELGSNVVSLIREDNSIRYSGGFATYPDYSTVAKILRINNVDVLPDTSGTIDLGKVITEHQDISHLASKSELSTKQDVIEDLVEIRDNADLAENSVQHIIANDITYNPLNGEIDLGKVVTSVKTINGESIEGSGNIEIGGSNIVIFNPEGDPAEEHAKLVDAYNNNRIVYLGMANEDGTLSPSLPVQFTINNETDPIYVYTFAMFGGSAIGLGSIVFIVSPTEISMGEDSYIEFITDNESLFLSGDGTYQRPARYINLNSEIPQNERNEIETAIRNGFSCFAYLYGNYVPCHIVANISDPESDYKVYTFMPNDTGGLTLTEWTITLERIIATNTTDFNLNNYALKSETGVAYAEYTGTSTAVVVTTKYGYFPTTLVEGARVSVKFEGSLTSVSTLNVNGTGAKNVYYKGSSLTSGMINQYNTYDFVYDGSYWRIIGVNTDSDTHYTAKNIVGASATAKSNATAANGNVYLNLIENSAVRSSHNIKGEGSVTVTSDTSGNIIISGSAGEFDTSSLATVATTGSYNDLIDKPTIPAAVTESTVSGWGFTKNEGTITGIKLNGSSKCTSGVVDLGNVVTSVKINGSSKAPSSGVVDLGTVGTYSKPSTGIPKADLASAVQTSLGKADTALQSYTEQYQGTVSAIATSETIDDVNDVPNVKYVAQTLTNAQKTQARTNIGAGDVMSSSLSTVATSGSYNDLSNKPTIPAEVTTATVSGWGFTKNTGTYSKPSGGIPKTDLASAVQTSLGKADTALQSYTEQYKGTITGVSANGTSVATSGVANIPAASTSKYGVTKLSSSTSSTSTTLAATASAVKAAYDLANGKQAALVSGTNIKTINGQSLLGSGNITIEGGSSGDSSNSEQGIIKPTGESEPIISPGVYNIVNIETFQWLCIINLDNIPSSSEISSGIVREWKLIIKYFADTPISFADSILWANDNAPEFEAGCTYEFSFIASLDVQNSVKILGIWSKFDMGDPASSGTYPT